ncbi:MAG: ABC transporter ATP-binding protein [Tissierellia bacterium]|nr:ABC transporter ATP-binding protein [Tissierellia bacterium]
MQPIRNILPYFKNYRHILLLDLFCAGLTTAAEIILPLILRYLSNLGANNLSALTSELVLKLALLYLVVKLVEIVAGYYMTSLGHIMGARIETDMRSDIYTHLQSLSMNFYNEQRVGKLMSRITNDLFDITEFSHHAPEEYFIATIKMVFTFVILIRIHVPLTLVVYLMIPLMVFFASRFRKKMRHAQTSQRKQIGALNASIQDSLSGVSVIKSFANEEIELDKFEEENSRFLGIKKVYYRSMAGFTSVSRFFDGVMYLLVILGGGYFMAQGQLEPGDLVVYVLYVSTMVATVRRIIEFTENFQKGVTGIERFQEIMDIEPDIKDSPNAIDLGEVKGAIEFKDVDFYYNEEEKILEGFNLQVAPGENVALVGPSGAGKTTVCNLIPRFYDVQGGAILLDGINIKDISLKSLRSHIGMVQQDVYLFNGTILDNIRFGKPQATEAEVFRAAELANALEFIQDLPEGFYTQVGERGVRLSGGQKQRLSIARVFLKNPPILILDEATSALDNQSEAVIQASLDQLSQGRTTLTIAHRLTTVQNAHRILVMDPEEGIVEAGNHEELMEKKGRYYQLYTKGGLVEDLEK